MAWSEFTASPELERIFTKLKVKYAMRRVLQPSPVIQIHHEGELDIPSIREILDLFPDFVYVEFVPNTSFSDTNPGSTFDYDKTDRSAVGSDFH